MTSLTDEDDLIGFSRAFIILARAKPANASFVENAVPGKISNFLIKHRGINSSAMLKWTEKNPKWTDVLKNAVRNPAQFAQVVNAMATSIRRSAATH
jgi:hypothetical protein